MKTNFSAARAAVLAPLTLFSTFAAAAEGTTNVNT